ncbi:MAG: hypothetical protein AAB921_02955, partial [Patescibacteria group bacterium]
KKKIEEIVTARYRTMFDLIDKHLKALGKRGSLPAGIIISGGASGQGTIVDIAKGALALPSRVADVRITEDTKIKDATWAVAYGLSLWGLTGDTETPHKARAGAFIESLARFFRQFLP